MKILLVSSYIFGYMEFAVAEMRHQGHDVEVYYYDKPPFEFRYKNLAHKILSGIEKIFGINERKNFRNRFLKNQLNGKIFDKTIVIHGQYLNDTSLKFLKSISKESVAFFFDSLKKMPRQKRIVPFFDKIFSYEPEDCKNENYVFLTNFIPCENMRTKDFKYLVFNISSLDSRLDILMKIAKYLKEKNISFQFQLVNKSLKSLENFTLFSKRIDIKETLEFVKHSKVIVDINRFDQTGLSFRPFEAMGNEKKLITNNQKIKKYDFYNTQNIWVINENEIEIPDEFFQTDYKQLPYEIYENYSVRGWVKKVLS